MTVETLKSLIAHLPDDMPVFLDARSTEHTFGLANSARTKEICVVDGYDDDMWEKKKVLILSEQ